MFLFTEAHFWSSAKSCRRKLHSYSLVLLLLSHPSLHWSRLKIYSIGSSEQGQNGKKSSISPAHSPTEGPLVVSGDTHWPQHTSRTGQQRNTLPAGKPPCLPWKMQPDLPTAENKVVETSFSAHLREPLSAEGKLLSSCLHRHIPGMESRNHNCASQTGTQEPPSLPAADIQHNAKTMKHQATPESQNLLWHSESSFTCTIRPVSSQPLRHSGILLAVKSVINLSL